MLRKMLSWGSREIDMTACNENLPETSSVQVPRPTNVRALATGAALAASLDASSAVVVELYDYAHRAQGGPRRRTA
jgi:hypothetical protein